MSSNVVNQVPFLRTSRDFPSDTPQALGLELNKAYIDIATAVNARTIGLFPTTNAGINGESWFLAGANQKQQGQRQAFLFSDSNLTITHNINFTNVSYFTRIWGTFFDGTYWNTLPYVDLTNVNNQINVQVSATQIIITKGAGSPPTISKGVVILEWISNP